MVPVFISRKGCKTFENTASKIYVLLCVSQAVSGPWAFCLTQHGLETDGLVGFAIGGRVFRTVFHFHCYSNTLIILNALLAVSPMT